MKLIKDYILSLLATSLLCYIILRRFARVNKTKDILLISPLISLLFSLFFVSLIIYIIYSNYSSLKTESIFTKSTSLYYQYLEKAHQKVYEFTQYWFRDRFDIIKYIIKRAEIIYDYFKGKSERVKRLHFAGIILVIFIPRVISALLFVFEIYYYQKLYWFYWSLPLLLLVYIYKYLKHVWSVNLKSLIEHLDENIEAKTMEPEPEGVLFTTYDITYYLRKVNVLFLNNKSNIYENNIILSWDYFQRGPEEKRYPEEVYYKELNDFKCYIPLAERLSFILWILKLYESKFSHNILILSLSLYAIGWFCIYLYSIKQEFIMTFCDKLQLYQDAIEPFSGLLL